VEVVAGVWVPFIGLGRVRRGGLPTMVGIQFPVVLRSKMGRGVDGRQANAGE
jgi:hypothetical protein